MHRTTRFIATGCAFAVGSAALAESQGTAWSQQNDDEVRSIVAEMLADAETRTSLLQSGGTAGHDGSMFFLRSADGNFLLNISGQMQFRYFLNWKGDDQIHPLPSGGPITADNGDRGLPPPPPPSFRDVDDFESGFTTNRTVLEFHGNVFDPSFTYRITGNFYRFSGVFTLEDAYIHKSYDNGWGAGAGQFRLQVLWEDLIFEKGGLAVDQSVGAAVLGIDRAQGIWFDYSKEKYRAWFAFSDGMNSDNTDIGSEPADWALSTRVEYLGAGDWGVFDSFSSTRGSDTAWKAGGSLHWQDGPSRDPLANATQRGVFSTDFMIKSNGWNAYTSLTSTYTDPDVGMSFTDYFFLVQGGYFLNDDTELFARYDIVHPDGRRMNDENFNTLTVGINHFMHGQAAKITVDATMFFDDTTDNDLVAGIAGTDRGDRLGLFATDENQQVTFRFQFQLLF